MGTPLLAVAGAAFVHPGIIVSREMLENTRSNVLAKKEPTFTAFNSMASARVGDGVWLGNLSYTPHPSQLDIVNHSLSPGTRWFADKEDSIAAYTHALLSFINQDRRHAVKAAEIMNAWSSTLTRPPLLADSLEAAWSATSWARAAEIVRHTSDAWSAEGVAAFRELLQTIYLPMVNEGASTNGNIALVMTEAALHIGIFCDNQTTVDAAIALYRQQAPAYIYLTKDGPVPRRPPVQRYLAATVPVCGPNCTDEQMVAFWHGNAKFEGHDGVAQETCRDLGHTQMLLAAFVNIAETAHHQGIPLYREVADRIVAAAEFHSTLLANAPAGVRQPWPEWLCGGRCTGIHCAPQNGTTFEMVHHHFVHRLNGSLPNVAALLPAIRPTGCWDQLCWETLTHGDAL